MHKHAWRLYHVGPYTYLFACLCGGKIAVNKYIFRRAASGSNNVLWMER
jgi:hypothetical protein